MGVYLCVTEEARSKPQVLLDLMLESVITPLVTNKNDKVIVPVSIFFQLHLLSVPIRSKDSHENTGVGTAAFDVSSHNRDFVEDLVRIWNNQKISFKQLSLTQAKAWAKGETGFARDLLFCQKWLQHNFLVSLHTVVPIGKVRDCNLLRDPPLCLIYDFFCRFSQPR